MATVTRVRTRKRIGFAVVHTSYICLACVCVLVYHDGAQRMSDIPFITSIGMNILQFWPCGDI